MRYLHHLTLLRLASLLSAKFAILLFIILFLPASASASPGELWVFGADRPVTADPSHQQLPAISGDIAIWEDCRPNGVRCRIFFRDISTEDPEQELIAGASGQSDSEIDADLIVWAQQVTPPSGGVGYQTYYKYMGGSGPLPVSTASWQQSSPAVSGSSIVWADDRAGSWETDIYMYDLATGSEQPVCTESSKQVNPDIEGDWAIWVDNRGGSYVYGTPTKNDIYTKNVVTGEESRLTFDEKNVIQGHPRLGRDPETGGYRAVYSGDGIWLYDFAAGSTVQIAAEGTRPDINGDIIVWESGSSNAEVFMHDLTTGESQQVSASSGRVYHPRVSGDRIVWGDDRNGNRDIYENRLGDQAWQLVEMFKPELHFKHDIYNSKRTDFEPRTVGLMVDVPGTKLVTAGGEIENPDLQDLAANPEADNSIDLPGSPANPFNDFYDDYLGHLGENPGSYPVTAYARVVSRTAESDKTVIQYWLCYYFNNWYNNHESDWEMVEVILDGNLEPEAAAYSQHDWAFKKYWNEPGFDKTGNHPDVYVAEGSHANYFSQSLINYADKIGDASSASPFIEMDWSPDENGWVNYAGLWGERDKWWWPIYVDEGVPGPAFQGYSWDDPLGWADSSGLFGYLNSINISVFSPADIHIYDEYGNHVGVNGAGGIDMQIPGSEYFEREGDHSKNIVIPDADILSNLRLEVVGTGTGNMDIHIQTPDFGGNVVDENQYLTVPVNPNMKGEVNINSTKDFTLNLDNDGDGTFEEQRPADLMETTDVDFTPPGAVTDLEVTDATTGTATLNWTAPGDDENEGTVARYEVRYSTDPITEESWPYTREAGFSLEPQAAGSLETVIVEGLEAGTTYYFTVRARDDVWQQAPLSNVIGTTTTIPDLTWSMQRVYWKNWNDYINRHLSIDYRTNNIGTSTAIGATVQASICVPETVYIVTPLPMGIGDLDPGGYSDLTLKYYVPITVGSFTTTTYVTCEDDAGRTYWFPEML